MMTNLSAESAHSRRAAVPAADEVSGARSRAAVLARETLLVCGGTAAIALIGQVALPLPFTPVPVTLGTFAALGVGGLLGSRRGVASALLLAALAALGAPVLAGWSGGVTAAFGYVLGYGLAAAVAGQARSARPDGSRRSLLARLGLMLLASAVVYVPGLVWLKASLGVTWGATLTMGLAPFVVGDVLKSVVASGLVSLLPGQTRFKG